MKTNINEYAEEMPVEIVELKPKDGESFKNVISDNNYKAHSNKRFVIRALNEGGCNITEVDLVDTLDFVKANMPDLWNSI